MEIGAHQHSLNLDHALHQHHFVNWLSLQVEELVEIKHRMLLISSTQQFKHGTLQH
jgi:hypothetical protein